MLKMETAGAVGARRASGEISKWDCDGVDAEKQMFVGALG